MTAEERKLFIRECAMRLTCALSSKGASFSWSEITIGAVALADELDRYENEVAK